MEGSSKSELEKKKKLKNKILEKFRPMFKTAVKTQIMNNLNKFGTAEFLGDFLINDGIPITFDIKDPPLIKIYAIMSHLKRITQENACVENASAKKYYGVYQFKSFLFEGKAYKIAFVYYNKQEYEKENLENLENLLALYHKNFHLEWERRSNWTQIVNLIHAQAVEDIDKMKFFVNEFTEVNCPVTYKAKKHLESLVGDHRIEYLYFKKPTDDTKGDELGSQEGEKEDDKNSQEGGEGDEGDEDDEDDQSSQEGDEDDQSSQEDEKDDQEDSENDVCQSDDQQDFTSQDIQEKSSEILSLMLRLIELTQSIPVEQRVKVEEEIERIKSLAGNKN